MEMGWRYPRFLAWRTKAAQLSLGDIAVTYRNESCLLEVCGV